MVIVLLEQADDLEPEHEVDDDDVLIEFHWGGSPDAVDQMIAEDSFKYGCLSYIAGYIVSKISKQICCFQCVYSLTHSEKDPLRPQYMKFLERRQGSSPNVTFPSNSVMQLVVACDKIFEREVELNESLPKNKDLITCLTVKVIRMIDLRFFFPATENHDQDPANYEIHVMTLAKCVVKRYFRIRCLSYLKMLNQKHNPDPSIRNAILKKLQFTGL